MTAGCAIVTGASRGFGLATAVALGERGFPVVMAARDGDALEAAAAAVRSTRADVLTCQADVASEPDVDRLVESALGRFARIEVLVNNAGAPPLLERLSEVLSWEDWRRHVDVDVRGVFNGCRRVAPLLSAQGGGTIVNVSSGAAAATSPLHVAYTPAKLAIVGLSRTLASDVGGAGVAVHCLCPDITLEGEVGAAGIATFAAERGVGVEEWLAKFGPKPPSSAKAVGEAVVELIGQPSGVWHVGGAGLARWDLVTPPPRAS